MVTTNVKGTRIETDSMGAIEVPSDQYYGAQTARSLIHFDIGDGAWPRDVMPQKWFAPWPCSRRPRLIVNHDLGKLDADRIALDRSSRRRGR